jgi:Cu/Ag efflux protein CusF
MSSRRFLTCVALTTAVLAGSAATLVLAQKAVTQGAAVSETAVIHAIDSKNRIVTLKVPDGTFEEIYCGPDVQRFDALKVGDTVTFRYYESVVYAIQKPGATPPKPDAATVTRTEGTKPGGTISRQMTATVTVLEIDPAVPSVTIRTEDGNKMSFKVEDKKNIEGLKVGDRVQVTYTQALAISVQAPGK